MKNIYQKKNYIKLIYQVIMNNFHSVEAFTNLAC